MNKVVTIFDAKTHLSRYIEQAKAGQPVYIGSYGKKEVVLSAAKPQKSKIIFGTSAGKFKYAARDLEGIDRDVQKMFLGN